MLCWGVGLCFGEQSAQKKFHWHLVSQCKAIFPGKQYFIALLGALV